MPKITNITVLEDGLRIFGLGEDNKIYEWHQADGGSWKGHWYFPTDTTGQFRPHRDPNPGR